METKHTPGGWQVGEENDVYCEGACIAKVCGAPDGIEESLANARLIAAAPELLEALKTAQVRIFMVEGKSDEYNKAAAAIAKATGI